PDVSGPGRQRAEEGDHLEPGLLEEVVADADPAEVPRGLGPGGRVQQLLGREEAQEDAAVGQAEVEAGRPGDGARRGLAAPREPISLVADRFRRRPACRMPRQRTMAAVRSCSRKPRPKGVNWRSFT